MLTSQEIVSIATRPGIEELKRDRLTRPRGGAVRSWGSVKLGDRRIQCRRGSGRREILAA